MGVLAERRYISSSGVYQILTAYQRFIPSSKVTEGTALQSDETRYYKDLCGRLDLVLVFMELGEN